MINPEKIDEIRSAADIIDIVSRYIKLKPSGRNFKAKSPFNPTEKTPSFIVSPEKQIFKCFSTGKGGNVFTFIQEIEKIPFLDSVKVVANVVGIELPKRSKKYDKDIKEYNIISWAASLFHKNLNQIEAKKAIEYLKGRGIKKETIRKFCIGYALDGWQSLFNFSKKEGIELDPLMKLGLVSQSQNGKVYDTFRDRIMFPIFSNANKVQGFGARALEVKENVAKYINSSESKIFQKSKILYGLNLARDSVRRQGEVLLVEGYLDVISLHQAGVENTVATSGTALTFEQASIISRYTNKVVFVYDADEAGINAMNRGIDILLKQGLMPNILTLPDEHDPDSYVQKFGKENFLKCLNKHRMTFLDFKLAYLKDGGGFDTPEKKIASIREIIQTLANIPDNLTREIFLSELSEKTGVSSLSIYRELRKILPEKKRNRKFSKKTSEHSNVNELKETHYVGKKTLKAFETTFIKYLLESLYHGTVVLEFALNYRDYIEISDDKIKFIYNLLIEKYEALQKKDEKGQKLINVANQISNIQDLGIRDFMASILIEPSVSPRWHDETSSEYASRCLKAFLDSAKGLIMFQYDQKINKYLEEMKAGEMNSVLALKEVNNLIKKRKQFSEQFRSIGRAKNIDK